MKKTLWHLAAALVAVLLMPGSPRPPSALRKRPQMR